MTDDETATYPVCDILDCPGYGTPHPPLPVTRHHFTLGDAATIFACLAFTVGWAVMAHFLWHAPPARDHPDGTEEFAALLFLALYFGPPLWSASLAGQIIRHRLHGRHG